MLPLGEINIFLNKKSGSNFAISRVLEFYDLVGKNFALFHDQNSKLKWGIKSNRVLYQNKSEIVDKVLENIFNLDLIVIEGDFFSVSDIRKVTSIPIILVQKDHTKFWGNVDKVYDFWQSDSPNSWYAPAGMIRGSVKSTSTILSGISDTSNYFVSDIKSGWKSSLDDLIKEWKRNYRIDQILGDDD
jgi:hypothetical protein